MNIITFSDQLQLRMKGSLADLNADEDEVVKIGNALTFLRQITKELKQFTSAYKFKEETEEIKFFKEIKPLFMSQFIYYKKVFAIKLFDSFKDLKSRRENYYRLLQQLETFARKNRDFYEYCMTGTTYLDKQYFTRSKQFLKSVDKDETFTTGYDTRLAKILAHELLRRFIQQSLQKSHSESEGNHTRLAWTGSKTDLIELIYALHYGDVFNAGTADIKLIATHFENCFNVSLGNYYRTLQDIKLRKSGQTNFLDQLKTTLNKNLND